MKKEMCKRIEVIRGNKSQAIRELIARKNRDRLRERGNEIMEKQVPKELLDKMQKLIDERRAIKDADEENSRERRKTLELINCKLSRSNLIYQEQYRNGKYVYGCDTDYNKCYVSDKTTAELQKASDFYAIGKRKEAQEMWNKLIEEYKLGQ
jgi:hypothetical protein